MSPQISVTLRVLARTVSTANKRKGKEMAKKYTVSFKIVTNENWESADALEMELRDIIRNVVAPSFNFELFPLSFTVKKARN